MRHTVSIVIPVLNEARDIRHALDALPRNAEVIVVDGGSEDATRQLAEQSGATVIGARRGRALQMNAGAETAGGDLLVFLHADTRLPLDFGECMTAFAAGPRAWGRFDIRLSGTHPAFRLIEFLMNWRSRLTFVATGDQVIFVRRSAFEAVGGFPAIPLMEDVALCKRLKRISRPWCCHSRVVSDSRRWERDGIVRTVLLMWRLRLSYFLGGEPAKLVRRYYG